MKHLVEHLGAAGLTDKQARVYLSTLSLGPSTVQEISNASQITRSTTYSLIESLLEVGLMQSVEKNGKRLFTADPPERMIDMLQTEAEAISRRREILERALPELAAVEHTHKTRPRVYYYEGKEGIRRLANRFEESEGDFFEIVPLDVLREFFDEHEFEDHRERLVKKHRMVGRILITAKEPPVTTIKKVREQYGWEARYIEPSSVPIRGHVSVKGDEVYAFSYDGLPIGVVMESRSMASAVRAVFELAWSAVQK